MTERRGVERVLKKLNASVENGNYYEAHQMYRTLYFRYKAQQKYADARKLLSEGSSKLLQHSQHSSGCDLAILLVDILNISSTPVDLQWIALLGELHGLMPSVCVERPTYVSAALRWSAKYSAADTPTAPTCSNVQTNSSKSSVAAAAAALPVQPGYGHPELHRNIASNYWKEANFEQSRAHFLHSADGMGCARMLIDFHVQRGYPSEVDLFIASTVLQFLCLRKSRTAEDAFFTYTRQHPVVSSEPPFRLPLLNFLWLLLLAVEGGKLPVFTVLCEKYQPTLSRDPAYNSYLDKIGQNFFGVPPPATVKGGNMLDNLLQSLLGDQEEDEPFVSATTSSSSATRRQVLNVDELD